VALGSEGVGQRSVLGLAVEASCVEVVQSVLRHLVVACPQTELGRPHARDVAAVAGNRSFRRLLSRLSIACGVYNRITNHTIAGSTAASLVDRAWRRLF